MLFPQSVARKVVIEFSNLSALLSKVTYDSGYNRLVSYFDGAIPKDVDFGGTNKFVTSLNKRVAETLHTLPRNVNEIDTLQGLAGILAALTKNRVADAERKIRRATNLTPADFDAIANFVTARMPRTQGFDAMNWVVTFCGGKTTPEMTRALRSGAIWCGRLALAAKLSSEPVSPLEREIACSSAGTVPSNYVDFEPVMAALQGGEMTESSTIMAGVRMLIQGEEDDFFNAIRIDKAKRKVA
jgi:hypothetical protein